jgi:hypothetical protein
MIHPKIANLFGKDLIKLLGPVDQRVPWDSLSEQEKAARIKKIPDYVNTRVLGSKPKLVDIVIHCFSILMNMGNDNPLLGIELPQFDSLQQASKRMNMPALNYAGQNFVLSDLMVKNSKKQRDVFLRHIFEDIILRFNPSLVMPGIGRMTTDEKFLFVNDGQHRMLACLMLGIEQAPVIYIVSNDEYYDVQQYAAINIHSLVCSEFDRYRIRVQRQDAAIEAGLPGEPEDRLCYDLNLLFDELGITVAEKSDKSLGINSLVLNSIGNMIKYRKEYGKETFDRATRINASQFSTSKFHSANSWGLMEFMKAQDKKIDTATMDYYIQSAISKRWAKSNAGGKMHSEIKQAYKEATKTNYSNSRVPEQTIIAEGIYQICSKYSPEIKWKKPKWPKDAPSFELALI